MSIPTNKGAGPRAEEVTFSGSTDVDPTRRHAPRVDTLTEDFARLIGRKSVSVGQIVGDRFKLLQRLGGGSMGEVFVAENLSINVKVAVKLLKPDLLADASFRQRFQREAQAIAAIEHPHVARFLDLVIGDPTFIVMEYVRGPTLADRLRAERRLDPARAIRIAARLCWALKAAHAVGVVHRDLKPANVILAPDFERGELPKLIDFGLAKLVSQPRQENALSRAGLVIGTPHYMAPEQISGREVDARTDIYALGCLLHHLIAGQPPFCGDDFQVLYKHVHEAPPRLRKLVPETPTALEDVLARALAKDPAARFRDTAQMAAALEAALEPPAARVAEPRQAPTLRRRRPRLRLPLAAASVVVFGFGGSFAVTRLASRGAAASLYVVSEPPDARVEVDGRTCPETTPTICRVGAGRHTVAVHHAGRAPAKLTVEVRGGERRALQVALEEGP